MFSNGRFVRNLFEKAKMNQALRIGQLEKVKEEDYVVLQNEDIEKAYQEEREYKGFEERKNPLGF